MGTVRRRVRIGTRLVAVTLVAAGGVVVAAAPSDAAVLPARQHVQLTKLCPRQADSPRFLVENVTDDPSRSNDLQSYAPETIHDIRITEKGVPLTLHVVAGGIVSTTPLGTDELDLAPGESIVVEATGQVWTGPHFARFSAFYRGAWHDYAARQLCQCENGPTTTTSSTSTSSTSTSSTSTTLPATTTTAAATTTTVGTAGSTTTAVTSSTTAGTAATTTTAGARLVGTTVPTGTVAGDPARLPVTGDEHRAEGGVALVAAGLLLLGATGRPRSVHGARPAGDH